MKRILTALTLSAVLASPAWSNYINNKYEWDDLPPVAKSAYAMGVFDESITELGLDHELVSKHRRAKSKCVVSNKMTPKDLVDIIDATYRNDVSLWSKPPDNILHIGLLRACNI